MINACKAAIPELQALIVFGSFAFGTNREHSDIDIALLAKQQCLPFPLGVSTLHQTLCEISGRNIDLIDYRAAPTTLQKEIMANGIVLYQDGSDALRLFECQTLSDYQRLNFERAKILDQVRATGIAYGA